MKVRCTLICRVFHSTVKSKPTNNQAVSIKSGKFRPRLQKSSAPILSANDHLHLIKLGALWQLDFSRIGNSMGKHTANTQFLQFQSTLASFTLAIIIAFHNSRPNSSRVPTCLFLIPQPPTEQAGAQCPSSFHPPSQ